MGDVGLTGAALASALLLFNLGVEIGQGAIVLTTAPLVQALSRRWPEAWRKVGRAGSIALGLAGVVWFVQRAVGV